MKFRWWAVSIVLPAGLMVAALLLVKRVPQAAEFCDECVMRRDRVEWRLAGSWTLFEAKTVSATPVSELLGEYQCCPAHVHRWSAPRVLAESELATPDAPRVCSIGLLNLPRTVNFLRDVFEYTASTDTAVWREVAWQPMYASALEPALRFNRFPENGFASRAEFFAWWDRNSYPLFNRLHQVTEAD
jgi:hypothetical protein